MTTSTSTIYWYSTNGMDQKRLANRHVAALDDAFERQARVTIYDDEAFGNRSAIASPHLGTMTSGDIHYGLYRQPSLWQDSSKTSLDSGMLVLKTWGSELDDLGTDATTSTKRRTESTRTLSNYRTSANSTAALRRRQQIRDVLNGSCCIIS
ncbi:hypothetical protein [Absidia glauca]|jgi:hypothetical protein|uniref:Uncharacterized protein n=1 Tax=Absidia glauca TaxID=4829 RepID=A0A168QSH3_ABSGL|nr:hypothetical protein [Absidia glauca]